MKCHLCFRNGPRIGGSSGWTRTSNPPVNSLFFSERSRQFGAIWPVFIEVFDFGGPPETTRDRARLSRFCPSATVGLKLTRIDSTSIGSIEIHRIESKRQTFRKQPGWSGEHHHQQVFGRSFFASSPMRAAELVGQIRDNRGAAGGSNVERYSMGRRCPRPFKTERRT